MNLIKINKITEQIHKSLFKINSYPKSVKLLLKDKNVVNLHRLSRKEIMMYKFSIYLKTVQKCF